MKLSTHILNKIGMDMTPRSEKTSCNYDRKSSKIYPDLIQDNTLYDRIVYGIYDDEEQGYSE